MQLTTRGPASSVLLMPGINPDLAEDWGAINQLTLSQYLGYTSAVSPPKQRGIQCAFSFFGRFGMLEMTVFRNNDQNVSTTVRYILNDLTVWSFRFKKTD
jgi:hypothetical protein